MCREAQWGRIIWQIWLFVAECSAALFRPPAPISLYVDRATNLWEAGVANKNRPDLKGGQLTSDRQPKCRGWRGTGVGHANSQYTCGRSVLITRSRDGTLRNITSKRCPLPGLGSGDALPGSVFRRYSSDANGCLRLQLYLALAVRGSCPLSTASNGLPLPSLCGQRTVDWSSRDDGLCNQESGMSETRDLRIDNRQNFLSIHAHEHTKSRHFAVVSPRQAGYCIWHRSNSSPSKAAEMWPNARTPLTTNKVTRSWRSVTLVSSRRTQDGAKRASWGGP